MSDDQDSQVLQSITLRSYHMQGGGQTELFAGAYSKHQVTVKFSYLKVRQTVPMADLQLSLGIPSIVHGSHTLVSSLKLLECQ